MYLNSVHLYHASLDISKKWYKYLFTAPQSASDANMQFKVADVTVATNRQEIIVNIIKDHRKLVSRFSMLMDRFLVVDLDFLPI